MYSLANLRNGIIYTLTSEQNRIYPIYKALEDVLSEEYAYNNSRLLGMNFEYCDECNSINKKIEALFESFDTANRIFFSEKEGLYDLVNVIDALSERYEYLEDDVEREKWISDVAASLISISRKMEVMMDENGDQIRFLRKFII